MIKILGIPFHYGQQNMAVANAPDILRANGLIKYLQTFDEVLDLADISFVHLHEDSKKISKACRLIHEKVLHNIDHENFFLSIGGDHGLSLGTISGILELAPETIVVWVDAHGDINTPLSSRSKNFHGMPLSYLLGLNSEEEDFSWFKNFLSPKKLIYFGPRDLDPDEILTIERLGIQCFSSALINDVGVTTLLKEALKIADPDSRCRIHLSFDVDVFDESDFRSTGICLAGGPRKSEIMTLISELSRTGRLRSMDLVEYHPIECDKKEDIKSREIIRNILSCAL